MSIKEKTVKSTLWSLYENVGVKVFSIGTYLFIGRILAPEDFGLIALVNSLVVFLGILISPGLVAAIIQNPSLDQKSLSSTFWGNLLLSTALFTLTYYAAPWLAQFYHEPALDVLIRVASVSLLIEGSVAVHQGLLEKELRTKEVANGRILGTMLGSIVGITLALLNYGPWSLVIQQLILTLAQNAYFLLKCRWRPAFYFQWTHFKKIYFFSTKATLNYVNFYINNYSSDLIIGSLLGKSYLGYFSFAFKIFSSIYFIAVNSINRVALPYFSIQNRENQNLLPPFYKFSEKVNYLVMPLFGLAAATASVYVPLIGDKWAPSILIIQLMAVSGIILMPQALFYSLLISMGRPMLSFNYNMISNIAGLLLVGIVARYGVYAIATSFVVKAVISIGLFTLIMHRLFKVKPLSLLQESLYPLIGTAVSTLVVLGTNPFIASVVPANLIHLFVSGLIGIAVYTGVLYLLAPGLIKEGWIAVLGFTHKKIKA